MADGEVVEAAAVAAAEQEEGAIAVVVGLLRHKLGLGIGIAGGYATLGFVGYEGRFDYTAIGNVVNIASRLCDNAGDGEILINQRAYLDIEGKVQAERRGPLDLKGVGKQVESYNVVMLSEGGDLPGPTSAE